MSDITTLNMIYLLIILIVSYFIGNINPSIILSKKMMNIDIRDHHSKNAGASNTLMTLGFKSALVVGLVDIFKGYIVVLIVKTIYPEFDAIFILAGLFVILGHIYPVFFGFRGGKGTATFFGLMLAVNPLFGGLLIIIFAVVLFIFKYVTISTFTVVILAPMYLYVMNYDIFTVIFMSLFALLSIFKHRSNIQHMIAGKETSVYDVIKKNKGN